MLKVVQPVQRVTALAHHYIINRRLMCVCARACVSVCLCACVWHLNISSLRPLWHDPGPQLAMKGNRPCREFGSLLSCLSPKPAVCLQYSRDRKFVQTVMPLLSVGFLFKGVGFKQLTWNKVLFQQKLTRVRITSVFCCSTGRRLKLMYCCLSQWISTACNKLLTL